MVHTNDTWITSGVDIGSNHYIKKEYLLKDGKRMTYAEGIEVPEGAVFIGIHDNHHKPGTETWCGGWVGFKNVEGSDPQSKHILEWVRPLTIKPSLLCRCGSHGFIQGGLWVEAR